MLRLVTVLFLLGLVLGLPTRTPEDVKEFKDFLTKTQNGEFSYEENMEKYPWANPWENSGKYQGDIVLEDQDIEELADSYANDDDPTRNAVNDRNRHWPNNTIPFEYDIFSHNPAQRNLIQGVMATYERNTCVRFRLRTNEHDYVRITNVNDGCYAHVGRYANMGIHVLNLAPRGCMHPMIIFHELGHNWGFNHMHQSQPRDNWITINFANIQNGMAHNFNTVPAGYSDMLNLPYEYASNQHYGPTAFSTYGLPTMIARQAGGDQMGQLTYVTNWDFLRVNRLYRCPGAFDTEIRMEDANKPAYVWPSDEELQEIGRQYGEELDRRMREESK